MLTMRYTGGVMSDGQPAVLVQMEFPMTIPQLDEMVKNLGIAKTQAIIEAGNAAIPAPGPLPMKDDTQCVVADGCGCRLPQGVDWPEFGNVESGQQTPEELDAQIKELTDQLNGSRHAEPYPLPEAQAQDYSACPTGDCGCD